MSAIVRTGNCDRLDLEGLPAIFGRCKEVALVKKIESVRRSPSDRPDTPVTIDAIRFSRP